MADKIESNLSEADQARLQQGFADLRRAAGSATGDDSSEPSDEQTATEGAGDPDVSGGSGGSPYDPTGGGASSFADAVQPHVDVPGLEVGDGLAAGTRHIGVSDAVDGTSVADHRPGYGTAMFSDEPAGEGGGQSADGGGQGASSGGQGAPAESDDTVDKSEDDGVYTWVEEDKTTTYDEDTGTWTTTYDDGTVEIDYGTEDDPILVTDYPDGSSEIIDNDGVHYRRGDGGNKPAQGSDDTPDEEHQFVRNPILEQLNPLPVEADLRAPTDSGDIDGDGSGSSDYGFGTGASGPVVDLQHRFLSGDTHGADFDGAGGTVTPGHFGSDVTDANPNDPSGPTGLGPSEPDDDSGAHVATVGEDGYGNGSGDAGADDDAGDEGPDSFAVPEFEPELDVGPDLPVTDIA